MKKIITVASDFREELIDITKEVRACIVSSKIQNGLLALYAQ